MWVQVRPDEVREWAGRDSAGGPLLRVRVALWWTREWGRWWLVVRRFSHRRASAPVRATPGCPRQAAVTRGEGYRVDQLPPYRRGSLNG
ncbi:hypothetical protein GCM10027445_66640 [Amycolatopsis endophytica]